MKNLDRLEEISASLRQQGMEESEIFLKEGRSRRFEIGTRGNAGSSSVEQGWAIRAGGPRSSLFVAGTGLPSPNLKWPEPDGQPLNLPEAVPVSPWQVPADLDHALVAESEAVALLRAIGQALSEEAPGSRLVRAQLEEGTSETSILSTKGIEASYRSRASTLWIEVLGPDRQSGPVVLSLAERDHHRFRPTAIASRLANRLLLSQNGSAPAKEMGATLIGSAVAARMLSSLLPLLLGPEAAKLASRFLDPRGRLGSESLTVVEDGRLPGGVLESPVDGEGLPTGPLTLIEAGRYQRPILDWREISGLGLPTIGCNRRESWRDLPRPAPSHLYIQPQEDVSVGELLASVTRGHYLLEPLGAGSFDFKRDRFRLPVCGFMLRQGRATATLSRTFLEGGISTFLRNIQAVARDLSFQPMGAMIGAPTLLVHGLGLRAADRV